jgi:hypothetical protein
MPDDELHARLVNAGLGRVAKDILRLTLPSIRVSCRRAEDETALPPGSSKLGGTPDLPSGTRWPTWQGSPQLFVSQVCLADIAPYDVEGDLPHSGLLSFFCSFDNSEAAVMEAQDDPSSWMVSYFEGDPTTLVRLDPPSGLSERFRFPACPAAFSRQPTLPDENSREILALGLSEPERLGYIAVLTGEDIGMLLGRGMMDHHLLGYPYSLGGSPFIHAGPASPQWDPYLSGREPDQQTLRDMQHRAEAEWRLLLQVYSNEEAQMDWESGGVLHFCIPRTALSQRDFDRVWPVVQSV